MRARFFVFILGLSTYGKSQTKVQGFIPKRWFFHFYIFATCFYLYLGYATVQVIVQQEKVPYLLRLLMEVFGFNKGRATVDSASVSIAMALILGHVLRRLYECRRVSIYADRGRISVVHYLSGFVFYFLVGISLLSEAKGFNEVSTATTLKIKDLFSVNHVIGVLVFITGALIQFKSHTILARLRLDSMGRVVSYTHSIPRGFLFELVSCPHYLAEIVIYSSLAIIFSFESRIQCLILLFVFVNQVALGIFNHNWYLKTFQDYPKQRKAIFPFIL